MLEENNNVEEPKLFPSSMTLIPRPPPPSVNQKPIESHSFNKKVLPPEEEIRRLCMNNLSRLIDGDKSLFCIHNPILPILQDGPMCGLVALEMAEQLICHQIITTTELYNIALKLGFTKHGEMFSAENLKILSTIINCKAEVFPLSKEAVLVHLVKGKPVLFSYDADKNHGPCLRQGHSAHWTVLCGFIVSSSEKLCSCQSRVDNEISNLFHCTEKDILEVLSKPYSDVFLLARHGKSRHLAAWNWDALVASNLNLKEVSPKRDEEEYVIPSGGLVEGLQNKVIFLG